MGPEAKPRTCGKFVYWWNGEYEGNCELLEDHEPGDRHFDGLSWFNDDNEEIPDPAPSV
jgi:hypothetical protein